MFYVYANTTRRTMVTNRKPKEMHPAHDHSQQPVFRRNHPSRQAGKQPAPTAAGTTASNVSTTGNATTPDASIALTPTPLR